MHVGNVGVFSQNSAALRANSVTEVTESLHDRGREVDGRVTELVYFGVVVASFCDFADAGNFLVYLSGTPGRRILFSDGWRIPYFRWWFSTKIGK